MQNETFYKCCKNPKIAHFDIKHDPKPISLSRDLLEAIERLLWYIPNINSAQSTNNELISNHLYDDFCFNYIIRNSQLKQSDILWIDYDQIISKEIVDYYNSPHGICVNCQKLILTKTRSETKTMALLRHIRNSIAHGRFTLCDNTLISFDKKNNENFTAIIKIKPDLLLKALSILDSAITKEALFKYAFEHMGYQIFKPRIFPIGNSSNSFIHPDLIIGKDGRKYIVEIKVYTTRYIKAHYLIEQMQRYSILISEGYIPVLIIDMSILTNSCKRILESSGIKIIDINATKELLNYNDILK